MIHTKSIAVFLAALGSVSAVTLDVNVLGSSDPAPDTMKPTTYPYCMDVVKNGKFEIANLAHWFDQDAQHCDTIQNDGALVIPVGVGGIYVGLPPIADLNDAMTLPEQGKNKQQQCKLNQDIEFKIPSPILFAQISWVDRITTQTNKYDGDQFTKINIQVMDNNPETPDELIPLFTTTNQNTQSNSVVRKVRYGDVTSLLTNMEDEAGFVRLALSLDASAADGPLYYQWDNVELWVCFAEEPADPFAGGDPHFTTWGGEHFTYNGVCDLVLLHAPLFANNLGLDIHIRTQRRRTFSFISHIAVQLGDDVLKISGGKTVDYVINGISSPQLPATVGGYQLQIEEIDEHRNKYTIELHNGQSIVIKSWYDILTIQIHHASEFDFGDSVGLMGDFFTGEWLARDGATVLTDPDAFGAEWQVGNNGVHEEAILFQTLSMPQYPQMCVAPDKYAQSLRQRRLGESKVSQAAAKAACSHVADQDDYDFCVYDVIAANDIGLAQVYM